MNEEIKIASWQVYEIDFDKVTTLSDVIAVLRGLQITVTINEHNSDRMPLIPYLKLRDDPTGGRNG